MEFNSARDPHRTAPWVAGGVTALVGFTSSFAVVVNGLTHVGANANQATVALFWTSIIMGLGCIIFSVRTRQPITMAWSTPGAALLANASAPGITWSLAVGSFIFAGALVALTGLYRPLSNLVSKIPGPIANAMLAGILLTMCVQPVRAMMDTPFLIGPVILTWLILQRVLPRWSTPGALLVAIIVTFVYAGTDAFHLPHISLDEIQRPQFSIQIMLSLGIPLYLVTMTSQNLAGLAVMRGFGYEVKSRGPLLFTGLVTAFAAPLGVFMVNLSAIAAAVAAGPDAHPDKDKRWVAGVSTGIGYIVLGCTAGLISTFSEVAPIGLLSTVAGLALLASFGGAAIAALVLPPAKSESPMKRVPDAPEAAKSSIDGTDNLRSPSESAVIESPRPGNVERVADSLAIQVRSAAVLTFAVAASGAQFLGFGAALWSLVSGLVYLAVIRWGRMPKKSA